MKTFFITTFLLLSVVFTINFFFGVSSHSDFNDVYKLTKRQKQNDLMVRTDWFEQRAWIKAKLVATKECPDLLILGSSTVGHYGYPLVTKYKTLNLWMGTPNHQDFEAITQLLDEMNCHPKSILFGVDPFYFNSKMATPNWKVLQNEYNRYNNIRNSFFDPSILTTIMSQFEECLSLVATYSSIKIMLSEIPNAKSTDHLEIVSEPPQVFCSHLTKPAYIRAGDGRSISCDQWLPILAEREQQARTYLTRNTHYMGEWDQVDEVRMVSLKKMIEKWRHWNIEVFIVSPPYSPIAYDILLKSPIVAKNLAVIDGNLAALTKIQGVHYLNFRDPKDLGCAQDEFEDSHHTRDSCFMKLINKLEKVGIIKND